MPIKNMKTAPVCAIVVSAVLGAIAALAIAVMVHGRHFNPACATAPCTS